MATILITGGTGMIGTALSQMLIEKNYDVILLSRRGGGGAGAAANGKIVHMQWDPEKGTIDAEAIRRADHIVHLAGAGVADKRWSEKRKREIVESRTHSSALLVKALGEIPNKVRTVVSASGIGWYGPDPSIPNPRPFVETDPVDDDFLGETCRVWEESISGVAGPAGRAGAGVTGGTTEAAGDGISKGTTPRGLDKRLVIFRIGLVLSNKGGALAEFRKPVKLGVAAILGSGKQVMSWIHVEDLCRLFCEAIENNNWAGVYNAVAPQPVDNKTLTLELAKRLKGRYYVPIYVPSFLLKIVVGEMSIEVLKSTTVSVQKLRQSGFQFLHPSIQNALDDLVTHRE